MPDTFGFFNLAWAGVILAGGLGLIIILQGCFQQNISTIKKFKIWVGAGLLVVALICLISAITIPENIILPIIAIIAAVALVLSLLATGGKKWDEGDNHKVGYKNYYQRKAEEEKNKSDDQQ